MTKVEGVIFSTTEVIYTGAVVSTETASTVVVDVYFVQLIDSLVAES